MRNARAGMTFLEIMIVMVIVGIMASVTIPSLRGPYEFNKLRGGAREVVALMRYARSTAIMSEVEVPLEIDTEKDRFRLNLDKVAAKKKPEQRKAIREGSEASWRQLPKEVVFAAVYSWDDPKKDKSIAQIVFYPDGSASDSRVVLENRDKKMMTIVLNRATALAEIRKGLPEDLKTDAEEQQP